MSHSITRTKVMFSGKIALLAAVLIVTAFAGQATADELTPTEQAAVTQHFDILATQQHESDNSLIENQQHEFDVELSMAEDQFMDRACDERGMQYDNDAEVCYK